MLLFIIKGKEKYGIIQILNGVGRIEAKDQQIQSVFGNELIHIMETAKKKHLKQECSTTKESRG